MSEATPLPEGPISMIISRTIKAGNEEEFEAWLSGAIRVLTHYPGYLGADVIRPTSKTNNEYVFIGRWDSPAHAVDWEKSPERAGLLESLAPLVKGETRITRQTGMEFWFTPPAGYSSSPPRWKMVIVSLLVLYPMNVLVSMLLQPVRELLPSLLVPLIVLFILIPLVTYIAMPMATQFFSKWLYPVKDSE